MKITDAEVKEFWEKCGFRPMKLDELPDVMRHESNLGNRYMSSFGEHYGLPPIDLNNLFKYAVPKLQSSGYNVRTYTYCDGTGTDAFIDSYTARQIDIVERDKDPATALFRAIQQVFKGN